MTDVFSIAQVAKLFSVAPHTILRWVQIGLLNPVRRADGQFLFRRNDINNLLAARGTSIPEEWGHEEDQPSSDLQLRVLIVDDEPSVIEELSHYLAEENVSIKSARGSYDAGQQIAGFRPHLVFLDLILPGMNGIEICKQIRSDPKTNEIVVVAMTGYSTDDYMASAISAGANACLPKPLSPHDVVAMVRQAAKLVQDRKRSDSPPPPHDASSSQPLQESNF